MTPGTATVPPAPAGGTQTEVSDLTALRGRTAPVAGPAGSGSGVPRPPSRWGTRVAVPLVIVLGLAGVLAYAARETLRGATEVWVVPVVAKPLVEPTGTPPSSDVPVGSAAADPPVLPGTGVQAPGWVEPDPFALNVPALIDGVVREVLVLEGDRVAAGQVVARLIDDEALIALEAAESLVQEREADLERARAAVIHAEAQLGVERAGADELRDEAERKRGLVEAGGVGAGEVRRLEIRLRASESRIAAAEAGVAQARATVALAEASLRSSRAARAEAALRLARTEVRSPSDGVVMTRLVEPGARVSMSGSAEEGGGGRMPAGAVLRLYDPRRLAVRVDVPLADAAKVGIGTRAEITTEALPGRTFAGAVARIVHEANIQRNTVQFKVAIEDPSPELKPEMLTRVRFGGGGSGVSAGTGVVASPGSLLLLLPAEAAAGRTGSTAVWTADASARGPVARRVDVVLGEREADGSSRVLSGLRPGDRVIVNPPAGLRPGTALRIRGEHAGSSGAQGDDSP